MNGISLHKNLKKYFHDKPCLLFITPICISFIIIFKMQTYFITFIFKAKTLWVPRHRGLGGKYSQSIYLDEEGRGFESRTMINI